MKSGESNALYFVRIEFQEVNNTETFTDTVDWEIFTLKLKRLKNFRVVRFSQFLFIREIFLTVDDCNIDERLASSWHLVYYQVSGEPGIARCSCRSDIYPMECELARNFYTDHRHVILFFSCLIFEVDLDRKIILTAKFSRSAVTNSVLSAEGLGANKVRSSTYIS